LAADILSRTVKEIAESSMSDEQRENIQARILSALRRQIQALYQSSLPNDDKYSDTNIRIHQITLEALKNIIEQCGESLVAGWGAVLESLTSVFIIGKLDAVYQDQHTDESNGARKDANRIADVISRSLARTAFATTHLVCSDFLAVVPDACLSTLLELLLKFSSQVEDLNMSLTVSGTTRMSGRHLLMSNRQSHSFGMLQTIFSSEATYLNFP
jgi:hypothetical protein